jgi:hypothetical protein
VLAKFVRYIDHGPLKYRMQGLVQYPFGAMIILVVVDGKLGGPGGVSLVNLLNERGPGRQTATQGSLAKLVVGPGCYAQHVIVRPTMTIHDDHEPEIDFDTGYIHSSTYEGNLMSLCYVLVMVEGDMR